MRAALLRAHPHSHLTPAFNATSLAEPLPSHARLAAGFGSEGRSGPPLGLDKHNIAWYMKFLKDNNFNAIRFLFNHETVLHDMTLEPPNEAKYGRGAPWEAPELERYKYLDMFVKLAEVAAEHGVLVMMACHRLNKDAWPGDGLWFDKTTTEQRVLDSWSKVAAKLCSQWNVFAVRARVLRGRAQRWGMKHTPLTHASCVSSLAQVDLQNEPHSASWAKGDPATDWGQAAGRIGNHVLSKCPRWLIMVEGVGYHPGAPGMDSGGAGIWGGENLAGAKVEPVLLDRPGKLVYTPHTYGPSVYMQSYARAHAA